MNSRYGLWLLSLCCISLVGCSNWQNRMGINSPGSAASAAPMNTSLGAPVLGAPPGTNFSASGPASSMQADMNSGLPPLSAPVGQKLDLSAVPGEVASSQVSGQADRPRAMYNLGGDANASSNKSSEKSISKSSTISKLASKASPKTVASAEPAKKSTSAVSKLSMDAERSKVEEQKAEVAVVEKPVTKQVAITPPPVPEKIDSPAAVSAIDTTLLAQPVRKGSGDEKSSVESKGPQSNALPGKSFFPNKKSVIYPVSNPAQEEPVELIKFS